MSLLALLFPDLLRDESGKPQHCEQQLPCNIVDREPFPMHTALSSPCPHRTMEVECFYNAAGLRHDPCSICFQAALGATEVGRCEGSGLVMKSILEIGDSRLFVGDVYEEGVPSGASQLYVYVPDVDAVVPTAVAAGFTVLQPPVQQFYGDRVARLKDPFGNLFYVATRTTIPTAAMLKQGLVEVVEAHQIRGPDAAANVVSGPPALTGTPPPCQ